MTAATMTTILHHNGTEAVTISEIVMKDGSVFLFRLWLSSGYLMIHRAKQAVTYHHANA